MEVLVDIRRKILWGSFGEESDRVGGIVYG